MKKNPLTIRDPIRRQFAERYLLIMLLSFAASVSLTRLFLELTGYPQIGSGELHIAHVLWGGLFLFAAALLPLLIANRWVYYLNALLAGIGVGLFIDEVGKFITKTNDYFYPSAAPIIYTFFLLNVLIFVLVRRKPLYDVRRELYGVLEDMEEVLDHDFSPEEQARVIQRLDLIVKQNCHPELVRLAQTLSQFVTGDGTYLTISIPSFWQRMRERIYNFEQRWMKQVRFRILLIVGMLITGLWSMYPVYTLIQIIRNNELQLLIYDLINNRLVRNASGLNWFEANIGLNGSLGFLLILASVLLLFRKERPALRIGYLSLLLSMTVSNLLLFYFDQFSTIVIAIIQFVIFMFLMRYRKRFIDSPSASG